MRENTRRMVVSAIMIALASVLSLIPIWKMPLGGSVTLLSMLPIAIISIEYGVKWGLITSFVYSLVQIGLDLGALMSWGLTAGIFIGSLVFDYIIAFTVIGLSGIFRKKGTVGICIGIGLAMFLRFLSHFISGTIFFASFCPEGWSLIPYSIIYNGTFMLPEMVFTIIASVTLFKMTSINKIMHVNN